jgi:hypothetical protein
MLAHCPGDLQLLLNIGLKTRYDPRSVTRRRRKQANREDNPGWLAVGGAALAGSLIGTAATFRGIGGNPNGEVDYVELDEYEGAVLLFPAEGAGIIGRTVDYVTGQGGYSHAALDIGLVNQEGEALWVDSWAMQGVAARPVSQFDRDPVRIPLTPAQASHTRAVALHMLHQGTPYRGGHGGRTCSELVVCCIPRSMAQQYKISTDATPNQLAEAFGLIGDVKRMKNRLLK